jgi:hypothetical protein
MPYPLLPYRDQVIEPIRFRSSMDSQTAQMIEHLDTIAGCLDCVRLIERCN